LSAGDDPNVRGVIDRPSVASWQTTASVVLICFPQERIVRIRRYDTNADALNQPPEKPEWQVKVWGRFRLMSTSESFFREVADLLD
jgi:hypothetical protein